MILKLLLFPSWNRKDVNLLSLWLEVTLQATYSTYMTIQSVHWRNLIWFRKLSNIEGKLLSTLIFETFVIRFKIYLKLLQNYQRQTSKSIVNSLLLKWSTVNEQRKWLTGKKTQAKSEQYSRRNNVEFSNIPNDIPDNQWEEKIIQIYRESGMKVDQNNIESCHRLPVSRCSQSDNIKGIVKFVNRKHSETLLYKKKSISSRDFSNIKIPSKIFVSVSLSPLTIDLFGTSAKTFRGQVKPIKYFVLVEQTQLNFPKVGIL